MPVGMIKYYHTSFGLSREAFMLNHDYRTELLNDIQSKMYGMFSKEQIDVFSNVLTNVLNDYSVTKSSTEIVPYDDGNARMLKKYSACLIVNGKSEKTVVAYSHTIRKLAEFLQKPYEDMDTFDIRYFLASEKKRGLSDRTLENMRANLSAFFQWMTLEEIFSKNPCMRIAPIKYADKVRFPFSSVEIDALRSACKNLKERALIEFLLSSGVRVSELSDMKITDVDMDTLSVHVVCGKGAKGRKTYIDELCKVHLQKYLLAREEKQDILFCNRLHEKLNPGGVRFILKSIGERAGVENVHPHRFRRTFATNLSKRGMDIQEIRKLLGHSNINTTLGYIYTDDSKVHASYRQYTN